MSTQSAPQPQPPERPQLIVVPTEPPGFVELSLADLLDLPHTGLDRLGALLKRFASKDVRGRLVIVGSAPSTGKSTFINELLKDLSKDATDARSGAGATPRGKLLLVPLHGPTLFNARPDPPKPADSEKSKEGDTPKESGKPKEADKPKEVADEGPALPMLREFVKALHFAVVRTATECVGARSAELAEVLRVDLLRGDADLQRLQAIWEGVEGLESGLFGRRGKGQGWREITALWNLNRAFMVISGVAERKRSASDDLEAKLAASASVQADWAKIATPALGLLAGGAVGALSEQTFLAGFLALVGALGGGLGWKLESERKRIRKRSEDFTETLDEKALFRWMPELVQQMKDVGLFPVIVVDEVRLPEWSTVTEAFLDKLDVCREVVNLGAFICLLSDRTTYRTLATQSADVQRRVDTAIADHIFVSFDPRDLARKVKPPGDDKNAAARESHARRRVFLARGRPMALILDPRMPKIEDEGLMAEYQAAVEQVVSGVPRFQASPEDRALALDLLYAPAKGLESGARVFDNSRRGISVWAAERGWVQKGKPAPPWLHDLRHLWIAKMGRTRIECAGAFACWRQTAPSGDRGWFASDVEGDAFVRDVAETVSAMTGMPLEGLLPSRDETTRLSDHVARNAGFLQELLTAGLLLAWLAEGGLTPTQVQGGVARWRSVAGSGVDGLTELQGLCGLDDALLDPWPLEADAWSEGAWGVYRALQDLEGVRNDRRVAAVERGHAAWRERLTWLAEGHAPPKGDRRFVAWSHISPDLRALAGMEARGALAWSTLALDPPPALAWTRDILLRGLGVLPTTRPQRVAVYLPDLVPDPGWSLPGTEEALGGFLSRRQGAWLDLGLSLTQVLWFVDVDVDPVTQRRTPNVDRTRDAVRPAVAKLPAGWRITLVGTVGPIERTLLEAAADAPCVAPCATLAETLAAADAAWATRGSPASRA